MKKLHPDRIRWLLSHHNTARHLTLEQIGEVCEGLPHVLKMLETYKNAAEFMIESLERNQRVEVALAGLKQALKFANEH